MNMKQLFKGWRFIWNIIKHRHKQFILFRSYPKFSSEIGASHDPLLKFPKIAIVLQGPIDKNEDFTLETVRIYKKIFHDSVKIIISTGEIEDIAYLKKIEKAGAVIVINKKPANPGPANINLQIISAGSGVREAKELGAEYVLKSRTDQRLYAANALEFLYNLIEKFSARIISTDYITFKYTPYSISDMTVFGRIDDMMLYWNPPLDERRPFILDRKNLPEKDFIKNRVAEIYLATEFLKKTGWDLKWTVADYWQALADKFCIIDASSLDLYWHKVAHHKFKENKYWCYDAVRNTDILSFREWFNIYTNLKNKQKIPEEALTLPPHEKIR